MESVDGLHPRTMRIIEAAFPPGASTRFHTHAGEEHHIVLEGLLRFSQGDHFVDLARGDYLLWDGALPHNVENIARGVSRALVITPGPGSSLQPQQIED